MRLPSLLTLADSVSVAGRTQPGSEQTKKRTDHVLCVLEKFSSKVRNF